MPAGNARGSKRRSRQVRPRGTVVVIDELLMRPVNASLNGELQQVRTIDAILLQLLEKSISGNPRAWRVFMQFDAFAQRRARKELKIEFVENAYTRSFGEPADG